MQVIMTTHLTNERLKDTRTRGSGYFIPRLFEPKHLTSSDPTVMTVVNEPAPTDKLLYR